jgi:hypothetical protein
MISQINPAGTYQEDQKEEQNNKGPSPPEIAYVDPDQVNKQPIKRKTEHCMTARKTEVGYLSQNGVIGARPAENILKPHHDKKATDRYYGNFYRVPTVLFDKKEVGNQDQVCRYQKLMRPQKSDAVHDLGIHFADIGLNKSEYREIKSYPVLFDDPVHEEDKRKQ